MPDINKNKTVIYATHKDNDKAIELRNKIQGDGGHPVIQNPQFFSSPVEDAGNVIIIGEKDYSFYQDVADAYEDLKGKRSIKFMESPALKEAAKKQKQRKNADTGGGSEAGGMPVPTESNTVKQIKGWLDFNDVDYDAEANKPELLEVVQANS